MFGLCVVCLCVGGMHAMEGLVTNDKQRNITNSNLEVNRK